MKQLEIANKILQDIEENGTSFRDAIGTYFRENKGDELYRSVVTNLVGTSLRHKMLFEHVLQYFSTLSAEDKRLIYLVMANAHYAKVLGNEQDVLAYLTSVMGDEKAILVRDNFLAKRPQEILQSDNKPFEEKYLLLSCNCPLWVYRTIRNTVNTSKAYNSIRELTHPSKPTVRLRRTHLSERVFLEMLESKDYRPTAVEDIYSYVGKAPLRTRNEWKSNDIFLEKLGTKYVLDQISLKENDHALMYCENEDCSPLRELIERYMNHVEKISLGVHHVENHGEVRRMINRDKLSKNFNFFSAEYKDVPTCLEGEKQNVIYLLPFSSGFDLIPTAPDYLLRLKESQVREYIASQKEMLDTFAPLLEENGQLVYMVYTINEKEGKRQISSFLERHPDFYLEKEEQLLPCDKKYGTALYYAIVRKGKKSEAGEEKVEVSSTEENRNE